MSYRKEEISFIVDMINKICIESNIALIPCKTKKGTDYVGILDNTTGEKYAMIKGE
jgi:hypothetical protein